jgi:hypothetical protein
LNLPPAGIKPNSDQFTEAVITLAWAVAAPCAGGAGFAVKPLPLDEHAAIATPSASDIETRNRVLIYVSLRV